MKAIFDVYLTQIKISIATTAQYRVANYFYWIGMITEPVIYMTVWSTIANAQGGSVGGYTAGQFAAYYIVWTLVRSMNIALTPYAWEQRIREGRLSPDLLRPIHPYHFDLSFFMGWKVQAILEWLPLAVVLALTFKPTFTNPSLFNVVAFLFALWGGFFVRFGILWLLGMITFWTTRVSAIFELYFTLELLLSGRLVPLSLMPQWAQTLANFLPFKWAFGFPIEVLIGQLTPSQILIGLGAQAFWSALGVVLVSVCWRAAIKRYSAVGA